MFFNLSLVNKIRKKLNISKIFLVTIANKELKRSRTSSNRINYILVNPKHSIPWISREDKIAIGLPEILLCGCFEFG